MGNFAGAKKEKLMYLPFHRFAFPVRFRGDVDFLHVFQVREKVERNPSVSAVWAV